MTRRRWIADEISGDRAALTGEHANHLVRVLRVRVGQEFDIAAGAMVRRGRVTAITDERVEFELGEEVVSVRATPITVVLAIFKFDRFEWAVEKCTELGVARIVPVIARRTDAHLAAASEKRVERWRRIALQAAEQSRQSAPPEITEPVKLPAIEITTGRRIVLAESEREVSLSQALELHVAGEEIALAIGPEGGWADDELKMFEKSGWVAASLGNTILRAETAAIAALAVVSARLA